MSDTHTSSSSKPASVRTRIAPSPTGFPHVGTVYMSIFDYVWAKQHAGAFIFRLEDTDRVRLVEGSAQNLYEIMRWSGLPYDEGPDVGGEYGPYVQSERLDLYRKYAEQLIDQGHAYYCFCTPERLAQMRAEQEKNHLPPRYDRHCLHLSAEEIAHNLQQGMPRVIRMKIPEGSTTYHDVIHGDVTIDNAELDDQVLLKSDGFPTYHLGLVVDDHLMAISDMIRGEEYLSSAPKHVLLYQFLGWEPPRFIHLPLLLNADKTKLSKRKNDVSVQSYRDQGYLPEAVVNYLSQLGWSHPEGKDIYSLDEMVELFSWDRVPKTGSVFSFDKMRWFNGQYIRAMSVDQLAERLNEYSVHPMDEIKRALPLIHDRLVVLSEFDGLVAFLYEDLEYEHNLLIPKNQTTALTREALIKVVELLARLPQPWTQEPWEQGIRAIAADLGWKAGDLFMTLRVASTFATASPPLLESMVVLGPERTLQRIQNAITKLA